MDKRYYDVEQNFLKAAVSRKSGTWLHMSPLKHCKAVVCVSKYPPQGIGYKMETRAS